MEEVKTEIKVKRTNLKLKHPRKSDQVSDCCLAPTQQFSAISN
jgi:hypothetical protein